MALGALKFELDAARAPAGEAVFWKLEGISMSPSFATGDIVWAVKLNPDLIRFWDVIFFKRLDHGGMVVMHRVWGKTRLADGSYEFKTKGDSCLKWDPGVRPDLLLGVGIAVLKQSGWLFLDRWPVRIAQGLKAMTVLPFCWAFEVRNRAYSSARQFSASSCRRPAAFWRGVRWFLTQMSCAF